MEWFMPNRGSAALRLTQRGQGMTEYIIIVALVAVAAIGVYQFFGQTVRGQTAGIAAEIAGQSAQAGIQAATDAAEGAQQQTAERTLGNYNNR